MEVIDGLLDGLWLHALLVLQLGSDLSNLLLHLGNILAGQLVLELVHLGLGIVQYTLNNVYVSIEAKLILCEDFSYNITLSYNLSIIHNMWLLPSPKTQNSYKTFSGPIKSGKPFVPVVSKSFGTDFHPVTFFYKNNHHGMVRKQ